MGVCCRRPRSRFEREYEWCGWNPGSYGQVRWSGLCQQLSKMHGLCEGLCPRWWSNARIVFHLQKEGSNPDLDLPYGCVHAWESAWGAFWAVVWGTVDLGQPVGRCWKSGPVCGSSCMFVLGLDIFHVDVEFCYHRSALLAGLLGCHWKFLAGVVDVV